MFYFCCNCYAIEQCASKKQLKDLRKYGLLETNICYGDSTNTCNKNGIENTNYFCCNYVVIEQCASKKHL